MKRLLVLSFLVLASCGLPSQTAKITSTPSPIPKPIPACVEIAAKTLTSQGKVIEGFFACNAPGELRDSLTKVGVTDDVTTAKWMQDGGFPWTNYTICGSDGSFWYIDLDVDSRHLGIRLALDSNGQIIEVAAKPGTSTTSTCPDAPVKEVAPI